MVGSMFIFHVYYQIRRILKEINAALPQDASWNAFEKSYDREANERICKEFGIDVSFDWRQKQNDNQGLGMLYNNWTNSGYHPLGRGSEYDTRCYSFTQSTSNVTMHLDYITQGPEATDAWTTFILDNASGFTWRGLKRINESIRTYCWALLGSHSQTRTDILGTGTAFDAQRQFLANVEDAINSPVDLPSQIARYQNTLKYARRKVDFAFGIKLYMSSSNMELRIRTIQDYNNEIVIATDAQDLVLNAGVNTKPIPPKKKKKKKKKTHKVQGTPTRAPTQNTPSQVIAQGLEQMLTQIAVSQPAQVQATQKQKKKFNTKNMKTIIFGAIVLGTALTLFKI